MSDSEWIRPTMATLHEWYNTLDAYHSCEGFALRGKLRLFEILLETFRGNCSELLSALEAMQPQEEPGEQTIYEFGDWVTPQIKEIVRLMHNFVASAMTLVDQSRVTYRELYAPNNMIPEYDCEIASRFKEDGLHQFIQGLRNMTLHYQLPPVAYKEHRSITAAGSTARREIYFSKENLLGWGSWTRPASRFIEEAPDPFEITPVVRNYREHVDDFHGWYARHRRMAHAVQLDAADRLEAELRRISCELRDEYVVKFIKQETS